MSCVLSFTYCGGLLPSQTQTVHNNALQQETLGLTRAKPHEKNIFFPFVSGLNKITARPMARSGLCLCNYAEILKQLPFKVAHPVSSACAAFSLCTVGCFLSDWLFYRGPGDVINDCKLLFLDEIYRIEKPGALPLSLADGQFKRRLS